MKLKKILLLLLFIFIVGCSKNELDKQKFIDIADFNGYIIDKDMEKYKGYDYIKDVYYAFNREGMYLIQFIELENADYAKRFFDLNKEDFVKLKTSNSYTKTMNSSNYNLYHLETDDSYKLIIRGKNNVIYIDAPIDYINEIEEFLNELDIDY